MLYGKPLNNFVTLEGRIIIDGKIHSTHEGNLMEWRHKEQLIVAILPNLTKIQDSVELEPVKSKNVMLSLKARDEGVTKNNEPYLHLFYYQNHRPTDKEVHEQILKLRLSILDGSQT